MSRAYKCDLCGALYDNPNHGTRYFEWTYKNENGTCNGVKKYEVCQECSVHITNAMNERKKND